MKKPLHAGWLGNKQGDEMKNQDKIKEILKYKKASYSSLPEKSVEGIISKYEAELAKMNETSIEEKYRKAVAWGADKDDLIEELVQVKINQYPSEIENPKFVAMLNDFKKMLESFSRDRFAAKYIKTFQV